MARIEGPKFPGPFIVDLTPEQAHLVDLAPNAMQGARGVQPNIEGVLEELAAAIPKYANDLEIHPDIYPRIVESTAAIPELASKVKKLEKLLEVAKESLVRLVNNREEDISDIGARAADKGTRGKKSELLAHFEQTIKYRSQIAEKAAKTRKKNAAAEGNAGEGEP
ncbi:MAG: hypothetical protein IPM54_18220 [Polyangiaceae bacterium]|nr:hypothetical protein [Polyangiaceae bacterium]